MGRGRWVRGAKQFEGGMRDDDGLGSRMVRADGGLDGG